MRVMITGGGTGGHTSPAVAIIEELRRRDPELLAQWVGRRGGVEERVSGHTDVPFRAVFAEGWPRRRSLRQLWVLAKLAAGVLQSAIYLRRFRPQVVIGVGGYVSLPLLLAAQRLGVRTVIHEQNKRLGMANRVAAARAARLFLSYEDTIGAYPRGRALVVGNPVRAGFITPPERTAARERFGVSGEAPVVLIAGGSQGARSINNAVAEALPELHGDEMSLLWMTGTDGFDAARAAAEKADIPVQVFPFIDEMPAACAAADLIVSRAGASTAAELAVLGKPAILIPYPHATDNHQEKNAQAFVEAGAAVMLNDAALTGGVLLNTLRTLLADPERRAEMGAAAARLGKPAAGEAIAEEIMTLVFGPPQAGTPETP